jgi:hypothetical protein
MNADFFNSERAPQYVLWRFGTIDTRFPTLDDGEVVLRMLSSYSPLIEEGNYTLWKRNARPGNGYSLREQKAFTGSLDEWIAVPAGRTWLRVQVHKTWLGSMERFLCRAAAIWIEVKLQNGDVCRYRLLAGNAASGFVINPLLRSDADLPGAWVPNHQQTRVVEARVHSESRFSYGTSLGFEFSTIECGTAE